MLPGVVLALLAVLPSATSTYVNCNIACKRCKEKNSSPNIKEIYCAMCKECRVRLRERALKAYRRNLMDDGIIDVDGLEPEKQARQLPGYDDGADKNDEAIINMGAPVDNLELIDELPGDDGYMENTDVVADDPDDKLILQPNTQQTSTKSLPKPKTTHHRLKTTHESPKTSLLVKSIANLFENSMGESSENSIENFSEYLTITPSRNPSEYPLHIPDGCPTPPICESDLEDESPEAHDLPSTNRITATTTTPPTPPPTTCPPIPTCKSKRKSTTTPQYMSCMPCMPWCPGACNYQNQNMWNPPWNQGSWSPNPNEPPGSWSIASPGSTVQSPAPAPKRTTPMITTCGPAQISCSPVKTTCGPAATTCVPVQQDSAEQRLPVQTVTPTTTQDFIYLYVGVPKETQK